MKRRTFIAGLGGVVACPLASRAQQPDRAARIGVLLGLPESDPEAQRWRQALLDALRQVGWRDSAKAQIDLRWAADPERMQQAAKELVQSQPDVIHVTTTPATTRVLRETSTIPVSLVLFQTQLVLGSFKASRDRVEMPLAS